MLDDRRAHDRRMDDLGGMYGVPCVHTFMLCVESDVTRVTSFFLSFLLSGMINMGSLSRLASS